MIKPLHDEFMDADMRQVWKAMTPLPNDLRLYGGTALALYLNHRASVDFDFATPGMVDLDIVEEPGVKRWIGRAQVSGGPGMVDAYIKGATRTITVTFLECGYFIPMPRHNPVLAANGVMVADPRDIIAAKYRAIIERGAIYDYQDAAAFVSTWPDWALEQLRSNENYTAPQIAYKLGNPVANGANPLTDEQIKTLQEFSSKALASELGR